MTGPHPSGPGHLSLSQHHLTRKNVLQVSGPGHLSRNGRDRASLPLAPRLAHRRAVRIRLGIHPPQLPHLLADAGRLSADHGAMITGQPEQPHAFEGHESRMT